MRVGARHASRCCALAQVQPAASCARLAPWLYVRRHRAAAGRRRHRLHRQGRAALARPRLHPLPALRDHEARGADARAPGSCTSGRCRRLAHAAACWPASSCCRPALIAVQPDLGTALLIVVGGVLVMLMAGLQLAVIVGAARSPASAPPWSAGNFLHDYQRQRMLHLPRPAVRPARRGLPHHPVADRHRLGRRCSARAG